MLFPVSLLGCFSSFLRPVAIFGLSVSERFGMDAIMLQEKLVERLLCPRVRTARQKVKKWDFWAQTGDKHQEVFQDRKRSKDTAESNFTKEDFTPVDSSQHLLVSVDVTDLLLR